MDKTISLIEINKSNSKEFKVEVICNSKVYAKKSDNSYLLGL